MEMILAFSSFFALLAAWIIAPGAEKRRPQPQPAYVPHPKVA